MEARQNVSPRYTGSTSDLRTLYASITDLESAKSQGYQDINRYAQYLNSLSTLVFAQINEISQSHHPEDIKEKDIELLQEMETKLQVIRDQIQSRGTSNYWFKTEEGASVLISYNYDRALVRGIKVLIAEQWNIPAEQIEIYNNDVKLEDDHLFKDYFSGKGKSPTTSMTIKRKQA